MYADPDEDLRRLFRQCLLGRYCSSELSLPSGFSEELDNELEDLLRLEDESDLDPDGDSEGYFDPLGRLTLRRADPR